MRRAGGFGWERVPGLEAPRAQRAPFRILSHATDPVVTGEGGGVGFATLALGQDVTWSRGDTRRRLEHDGPPPEAWGFQRRSMVGSDLLEPLSVCVCLRGYQETHVAFVDQRVSDLGARRVGLEIGSHETLESESTSPGNAQHVERQVSV